MTSSKPKAESAPSVGVDVENGLTSITTTKRDEFAAFSANFAIAVSFQARGTT